MGNPISHIFRPPLDAESAAVPGKMEGLSLFRINPPQEPLAPVPAFQVDFPGILINADRRHLSGSRNPVPRPIELFRIRFIDIGGAGDGLFLTVIIAQGFQFHRIPGIGLSFPVYRGRFPHNACPPSAAAYGPGRLPAPGFIGQGHPPHTAGHKEEDRPQEKQFLFPSLPQEERKKGPQPRNEPYPVHPKGRHPIVKDDSQRQAQGTPEKRGSCVHRVILSASFLNFPSLMEGTCFRSSSWLNCPCSSR